MELKYYAVIGVENICIAVTAIPIDQDIETPENYIELDHNDDSLLNKKYKDGTWDEVDPMYFYRPLSEQETAALQMQSDLEYLVCLKELGL